MGLVLSYPILAGGDIPVLNPQSSAVQTTLFTFYSFYMKCWVIAEFEEQIADIINGKAWYLHTILANLFLIFENIYRIFPPDLPAEVLQSVEVRKSQFCSPHYWNSSENWI